MNIVFLGTRKSAHTMRPFFALQKAGHTVFLLDTCPDPCTEPVPYPYACVPARITERASFFQKILQERSPDIVHGHWVDGNVNLLLDVSIVPVLLSVWGTDVNRTVALDHNGCPCPDLSSQEKLFEYYDLLHSLPRAAVIIVDDHSMIRKCRFVAGEEIPIVYNPLGIDDFFFEPVPTESRTAIRQALAIPDAATVFLSARAIGENYQHERILRAFARLNDANSVLLIKLYNAQSLTMPMATTAQELLLHGTFDRPQERQMLKEAERALRALAQELGVAQRVRFIASPSDRFLPSLYAAVDALVSFPKIDAFPVLFTEAAACGVRVLTPRLPAYEGTFVPACFDLFHESEDDLCRAMQQVMAHPYAEEKRQHASAVVSEQFRFSHYMERLLRLYQDVQQRPPSVSLLPSRTQDTEREPCISFFIPCYNYEQYLPECLASLQAQTFQDWEAIVVDDCSPANTACDLVAALGDARIRCVRHAENKGVGTAFNTAFLASRGRYISFLSADDTLDSHFCEDCLYAMRQPNAYETNYPQEWTLQRRPVDVVFCDIRLFGKKEDVWRYRLESHTTLTQRQWIPGAGFLLRREHYRFAHGHYEGQELRFGNIDWEFWLSVFRDVLLRIVHVPKALYNYRNHGKSVTDRRPYMDYKTRECLYRRHAAVFHCFGTQNTFLVEGYVTSAQAAWRRSAFLRSALLAAEAAQRLEISPPALTPPDIPEERRASVYTVALTALHTRDHTLPPTREENDQLLLVGLLEAHDHKYALAEHHFFLALGQAVGWQERHIIVHIGSLLLALYLHTNQHDKAQELGQLLHAIFPYEPYSVLLCAQKDIQEQRPAQAFHRVAQLVSHDPSQLSLLILGTITKDILQRKEWGCTRLVRYSSSVAAPRHEAALSLEELLYTTNLGRKLYWTYRARDLYARYGHQDGGIQELVQAMERLGPKTVLDFGCGNGRLLAPLREAFPDIELVGHDISGEALDLARQRQIPNVQFFSCPLSELPFTPHYFDLIICNRVLQNIPPAHVSEIIHQLLQLGKYIYINDIVELTARSAYCFAHDYDSLLAQEGFERTMTQTVPQGLAMLYAPKAVAR